MVLTIVEPFSSVRIVKTFECCAVEIAYEIFCGATTEETSRVYIHKHDELHVVLVTIYRQLYEIRALILTWLHAVAASETADICPFLEVGRLVETHFLVCRNNHIPRVCRSIPEHFRVTEILQSVERTQHGVALIFGKCTSVVGAVCHTLYLSVLVACRCVKSDDGAVAISGSVVLIHNRASREDLSQCITCDCRSKFLPVCQVGAHSMSPVHVSPLRSVRIVLEIKMILTVLVNHSVSIVHPSVRRCVMIERTVIIGVDNAPCVRHLESLQCKSLRFDVQNLNHGFLATAQFERNTVVCLVTGQTYVHPCVGRRTGVEFNLRLALVLFYRQNEIFLRIIDFNYCCVTMTTDVDVLRHESLCGQRECRYGHCFKKKNIVHRLLRIIGYYVH